jgi:hypothetical protein
MNSSIMNIFFQFCQADTVQVLIAVPISIGLAYSVGATTARFCTSWQVLAPQCAHVRARCIISAAEVSREHVAWFGRGDAHDAFHRLHGFARSWDIRS